MLALTPTPVHAESPAAAAPEVKSQPPHILAAPEECTILGPALPRAYQPCAPA